MEKNLNIPKRIITRRNTTCSVNANLRSRAASYDTEVEQQQQGTSSEDIEQRKYELLQIQIENEKSKKYVLDIKKEIACKKLEKLISDLNG